MFEIYEVTNIITLKRYIGMTTYGIDKRWKRHVCDAMKGSDLYFHRSIRKHGAENFTIRHFASATNHVNLRCLEVIVIAQEGTRNPAIGYNSSQGGRGFATGPRTESHKANLSAAMSKAKKGKPPVRSTQEKAWAANVGRKKSAEEIAGIKQRLTGVPKSAEHRRKLSIANTGKTLTPEHIEKVRLKSIGRTHSELTNSKMRTDKASKELADPGIQTRRSAAQKIAFRRRKEQKCGVLADIWEN